MAAAVGCGLAFGLDGFGVAANGWVDADGLALSGSLTTALAFEVPPAELPAASLADTAAGPSVELLLAAELVIALAEFGVRLLVQAARLAAQATAATHAAYRANP